MLSNYIRLIPGDPTKMHFTDHYYVERDILERESGKPKKVSSHVFYVNELGGEPASRTFSVLSQKLWAHLEPFLENDRFRDYDFIITQIGDGFLKDWNVQVIKRPTES